MPRPHTAVAAGQLGLVGGVGVGGVGVGGVGPPPQLFEILVTR